MNFNSISLIQKQIISDTALTLTGNTKQHYIGNTFVNVILTIGDRIPRKIPMLQKWKFEK